MANRLATSSDVSTYSAWISSEGLPAMEVDDIIIDSYTNVSNKAVYYNSSTTWSGARDGATIWLLADTFDNDISYMSFAGNGSAPFTTTSANPCHIRPLNGRIRFKRLNTETQNVCIEIQDIEYCVIDGELRSSYPGIRHGIDNIYLWQQFGFWLMDTEYAESTRMCSITGSNLKGAGFRGVCLFGGFSGFRAARSNDNQELDWFFRERCVAVFGVTGEGSYIGQTTDNAANPIFKKVTLTDNIDAYRGREGWQVQNIAATAGESNISNFVCFSCATDWKDANQANQDGGIQWEIQDANNGNFVQNGVIHGWGGNGVQIFSSDKTARGYTAGSGVAKCKNLVMDGGRKLALRTHGSMDDGPALEYRDIDILGINDTYDEISVYDNVDYFVESASESGNKQHFININHPSGKSEFFASTGTGTSFAKTYSRAINETDSIPAISYINMGFSDVDVEKIELWKATAQRDTGTPATSYTAGDYVINAVVDTEYKFYKCISTHTSSGTSTRPDNDATKWTQVTWDESGVRSDAAGWSSGDTQSDLPPIDFRLTEDSYHNKKRRGLSLNPPRTDQTQHQWQYAINNTPSYGEYWNVGGATELVIDTSKYNYLINGLYLRCKITETNGTITYTDWTVIS